MKILLIEDNQDIAGIIFDFFEIRGDYLLDYASDGRHGLELASKNHYDLIILDIMLPLMDGLEVCNSLRSRGVDIPILMLTARSNRDDILEGFEQGADDYLVKPFDLNILEARVQALYRRKTGAVAIKSLSFGELKLDLVNRVVERSECRFKLNQTQFTILKTLLMRAPDVATRDELIKEVWQDDEPDGDVLRSHIYQLRSQIDKPFRHAYIKTVPKVGYQLTAETE